MSSNHLNEVKNQEGNVKGKKSSVVIAISLFVLIAMFVGIFLISKNNNSSSSNKKTDITTNSKLDNNKKNDKESMNAGKKNILVKVIDNNKKDKEYKHSTNAEYLRQALEEIDGLSVEGEETNTGLFVKKVNGIIADYNVDKSYWAFYINGEYCQKGVDTQEVTDGDEFEIVYIKD